MSGLRVVRRFGSGRCHVADVAERDLVDVTVFGSTGKFVAFDPVAAVCGANLRGEVVVMTHAKVDCRPCVRLSGVTEVSERAPRGTT